MTWATKKSQLQMQLYVNCNEAELNEALLGALPSLAELRPRINWVSPLERDGFAEYWDKAFLDAIGRPDLHEALADYWPPGGPHWDALAIAQDPEGRNLGPLLVEAKSYPAEMRSSMQASPASAERILGRLQETRGFYGVAEDAADAWTQGLYQPANRYAHLRWFRDVLNAPAWLANVYFVEDPDASTTQQAWSEELRKAELEMGLADITVPHAGRVFLQAFDTRAVPPSR